MQCPNTIEQHWHRWQMVTFCLHYWDHESNVVLNQNYFVTYPFSHVFNLIYLKFGLLKFCHIKIHVRKGIFKLGFCYEIITNWQETWNDFINSIFGNQIITAFSTSFTFVLYAKQFCDHFIITHPMQNTNPKFAINLAYNGIINQVWTR